MRNLCRIIGSYLPEKYPAEIFEVLRHSAVERETDKAILEKSMGNSVLDKETG